MSAGRYVAAGMYAGVLAGVLAISACSSNSTPTPPAQLPKPTVPRDQLALVQSDFPAGVQFKHLSTDQLTKFRDSNRTLLKNAKYEPAKCGELINALHPQDLNDKTTTVMAGAGTTNYEASVIDQALDLNRIRSGTSGDCAQASVQVSLEGQTAKTTKHSAALPLPDGLNASDAIVFQQTADTELPGEATPKIVTLVGVAVVRGMSVQVQETVAGGNPDAAVFDKLFKTAVDKVLNAK